MGKVKVSIDGVIEEFNPVGFWQRLRQMPVVGRVFAIVDRCLC
ncbi:hypothetical protein BH23ACT4_BH23ACT4_00540 [soil metagenome]